jgi:tagatose-6-phosphate ketose/aldose isomerase
MQFLGYNKEQLGDKKAYRTAIEISHQPDAWQEAYLLAEAARSKIGHKIDTFLQLPGARIILSGAGSSAFIGGCLAPIFRNQIRARVDAIATTDLVANPDNFFEPNVPTLMVSFAR